MLVLEKEEPNKTQLCNLPTGTIFKYIKGQINATYIKTQNITNNFEEILCLNTGKITHTDESDTTIVHPYTSIHPIIKPLTNSSELKKISYKEIKPGECFVLDNSLYMKTDKDMIFNLITLKLIQIKLLNYGDLSYKELIHMPFVALELI